MNRLPVVIITALWFITIVVSYIILRDTGYYSKLGPVYFICMIGSIITVNTLSKKISDLEKRDKQ